MTHGLIKGYVSLVNLFPLYFFNQPLVFRLDVEHLESPLLPGTQSLPPLAFPLGLGPFFPGVLQDHRFAGQGFLEERCLRLLHAVRNERTSETLRDLQSFILQAGKSRPKQG